MKTYEQWREQAAAEKRATAAMKTRFRRLANKIKASEAPDLSLALPTLVEMLEYLLTCRAEANEHIEWIMHVLGDEHRQYMGFMRAVELLMGKPLTAMATTPEGPA